MRERWLDDIDRDNQRFALVASFIANTAPAGKRKRKALVPTDIIPLIRGRVEEEPVNSWDDHLAVMKQLYGCKEPTPSD